MSACREAQRDVCLDGPASTRMISQCFKAKKLRRTRGAPRLGRQHWGMCGGSDKGFGGGPSSDSESGCGSASSLKSGSLFAFAFDISAVFASTLCRCFRLESELYIGQWYKISEMSVT